MYDKDKHKYEGKKDRSFSVFVLQEREGKDGGLKSGKEKGISYR